MIDIAKIEHYKNIRKEILYLLYKEWESGDSLIYLSKILDNLKIIEPDSVVLDRQFEYLEKKYFLELAGGGMSAEPLAFSIIKLTAHGIDLVEDPDEFNKLFRINISVTNKGDNITSIVGDENNI